jgi:hypothetical protein
MEKEQVKKAYQTPSWRKQEVMENFGMQAACAKSVARAGCTCTPIRS